MNYGNELKMKKMIVAVNAIFCNCVKKPAKKIQDFNGV